MSGAAGIEPEEDTTMRRVLVAVLAVSLAVVLGAGGARAQGGPPACSRSP